MSQFISWVEKRGKIYFLTGEQLFETEKGKEFIKTISQDDLCGHGTIRAWYGIDTGDGIDKEQTNFSAPNNFPPAIVSALKSGKFRGLGTVPGGLLRKPIEDDYWAKRKPIDDDYRAKLKPIEDDYRAKLKPIDEDCRAKVKPIEDDYWAKLKPIDDDYRAKLKPIDEDCRAKLKPIEDDYWGLFVIPENRSPAWV